MSRDIDAQVADKVFGAVVRQDPGPSSPHFIVHEWESFGGRLEIIWSAPGEWYRIVGDPNALFPRASLIPMYSTDAGAAMRVVDRLREAGMTVSITCKKWDFMVEVFKPGVFCATASGSASMPAAVCEAALAPETLEALKAACNLKGERIAV